MGLRSDHHLHRPDDSNGLATWPTFESRFVDNRNALRATVEQAINEDAKGSVSSATSKRSSEVVASFRTKFLNTSADYVSGYQDALDYFTTLASLTRLLNDPMMKAFLEKLDDGEERTVGELVAFMRLHNLRFGPATSDRQIEIYTRLVAILSAIREESKATVAASIPDRTGESLRSAAKDAFKGMSWDQLERIAWAVAARPRARTGTAQVLPAHVFEKIGRGGF